MSVKLKETKGKDDKVEVITFKESDYMAIEGLKGSLFEGKTKVVHKIHGSKIVAKKLAKEVKVELEKVENLNRTVKDLKK
ncbi:hypothetical protein Harreka1_78 [Olleya phage Harreka_1]|uniref:Uncharacterized protein n=1 Tax=Olleya phage Harreka_1 TaxID=2745673 RepID=A0A8E4ZLS4_9CAUD|nr:hypothetical protein M1M26_gp78 [Olleya phage Harreka_1]QQV90485.1 hypothetical protein Harreka1_78 [Olleya phage Harreka_1]